MSFLLVTNDDGIDSPALVPLMQALEALTPVRAVVPDRERSWIGKAITRHDDVVVKRADREGCEIWTTTGFPADCAQIGAHALFDERPEMLISGINIGLNHGLAFLMSSGTVGAASEGWIAGLPAVAISTGNLGEHRLWADEAWHEDSRAFWEGAAAIALDIVRTLRARGMPAGADLLSVNFPDTATVDTPREVTRLARTTYDQLFQARTEMPGTYFHDFGGFRDLDGASGTDLDAARRGHVSITPVRFAHTAAIPDADRHALEQP